MTTSTSPLTLAQEIVRLADGQNGADGPFDYMDHPGSRNFVLCESPALCQRLLHAHKLLKRCQDALGQLSTPGHENLYVDCMNFVHQLERGMPEGAL